MIKVEMFFGLIYLVLFIYCLIEAITSPDGEVRNLPKVAWIFLILFFPFVGSIAWLAAGRPVADRPRTHERPAPAFPEYDRPGRAAGVTPESDEEFLRRIRERAEEQRRIEQERRKREQENGDL
jgi:hypothetical protein